MSCSRTEPGAGRGHEGLARAARAPDAVVRAAERARAVRLTATGPALATGGAWRAGHDAGVLVRPLVVGVCRSDVKEVARQRQGRSQFGHELVGRVQAVWGDVRLAPGALVALDPNVALSRGTAFAELMPADGAPAALAAAFYRLPAHVDPRRLVFAEPLACALHCARMVARHLGVRRLHGRRVAVLGAGIAGALIAMCARELGASVSLVNRSPDRLALVRAAGLLPAEALCAMDGADGRTGLAGPGGVDVVILATAFVRPDLIDWALSAMRAGGLVVLYGGTRAGDRLAGVDLDRVRREQGHAPLAWRGRRAMVAGAYGTERASFRAAVRLLAAERFALERLIVRELGLGELPGVLEQSTTTRCIGKTIVVL